MENDENLIEVEKLNYRPFTKFCMSIGAVPSSYLASMTMAEQMLWLSSYLENEVVPAVNNNGQAVEELQGLYVQLHDYVEHYFDNLDVQEEINNKLDQLVQDGTLESLIGAYVQPRIDAQNQNINQFKIDINNTLDEFETTVDGSLDEIETNVNYTLNQYDNKIDNILSGSPIVVSSTSAMTDTTKTYLNTTDSNWYYYNGSAWTVGGAYLSDTDYDEYIDDFTVLPKDFVDKNRLMRNNLEINTGKVVAFDATVTVDNFATKLSDSAYSNISNPRRIRYDNGKLIYDNLYYTKNSNFSQPVIFFFDKDGDYIVGGDLNNANITAGSFTSYIPSTAYYFVIKYLNNAAFYDLYISDVTTEWLHDKTATNYIQDNKITPFKLKEYKKKKLKENLVLNTNKGMPTLTNYYFTVDSITFTDSTISDMSPLIQLKYLDGTPIINEWNWQNMPSSGAIFLFYFDRNKLLIDQASFANYSNTIPENAYYCYIRYFNNLGTNYDSVFEDVNVEWLNPRSNTPVATYYVGADNDDDYSSVYACFDDLKNNTDEKIIYIKPGLYNLYDEILELKGSEYLSSLASPTTWQEANVIVPTNAKVIGLGNVVLQYQPSINNVSSTAVQLISPLNVIKDCDIQNITIKCSNCRYGIHDEAGTDVANYYKEHKYKNVTIFFTGTNGLGQAFGGGFLCAENYGFENCLFSSTRNTPFSIHNGAIIGETAANLYSANLNFNNCKFIMPNNSQNSELLLINGEATQQLQINVNISNCYFKNEKIGIYRQQDNITYLNAFKLIINNSNIQDQSDVVIAENVTNNLPVEIYNAI